LKFKGYHIKYFEPRWASLFSLIIDPNCLLLGEEKKCHNFQKFRRRASQLPDYEKLFKRKVKKGGIIILPQ